MYATGQGYIKPEGGALLDTDKNVFYRAEAMGKNYAVTPTTPYVQRSLRALPRAEPDLKPVGELMNPIGSGYSKRPLLSTGLELQMPGEHNDAISAFRRRVEEERREQLD